MFLRRRFLIALLLLSSFIVFLGHSLLVVGHHQATNNPRYLSGETSFWGGIDEHLYTVMGYEYLDGIQRLDFSSFLLNAEHPFLAKLLVGMVGLLLTPAGFGEYPVPSRVESSLAASVVCLVVFLIVEHEAGSKYALFSWTILVLSYVLYPLERFIGPEINGISFTDPDFGIGNQSFLVVPIDNTCLMFSSLSIYLLAWRAERRELLLAGILYGLASLSKLTGFFAMGLFLLGWLSFKSDTTREWLSRSLWVLGIGWLVFFLMNPSVWVSGDLFLNFRRATGLSSGQPLWVPLFNYVKAGEVEYGLAQFLACIVFGSGGLWLELPVFQLFSLLILSQFWVGRKPSDLQVLSLLWFASFFFVVAFSSSTVVIGGWLVLYYAVTFPPPLALFCGLDLQHIIKAFMENGHVLLPDA